MMLAEEYLSLVGDEVIRPPFEVEYRFYEYNILFFRSGKVFVNQEYPFEGGDNTLYASVAAFVQYIDQDPYIYIKSIII